MDNFFADYPVEGGSDGVTSINGETGDVNLVAGANITITPSGNDIIIASTGGSGSPLEIEYRTITAPEGASMSLVLAMTPSDPTLVILGVAGGGVQVYGTDFTVSGSTLSWAGTALDGILTTGDQILLQYNV